MGRKSSFLAQYPLLLILLAFFCCGRSESVLIRVGEKRNYSNGGTCEDDTGLSLWFCSSLQAGLTLVQRLNETDRTFSVLVPPGEHVIDSPVHLGSASVELVGVESTAGPPVSIQCTYNIDVDQEQIFNLSYVYTLYFNRSKSVSISNINMRGCQFPLRLDTIGRVDISNSSFMFFTEAVLDIFNTLEIDISDCIFHNNSGTGISRAAVRGNTGAVSIGFNNIAQDRTTQPSINVSSSNFSNNQAKAEASFLTPDNALSRRVFTGRGGALGIFINESQFHSQAMISDCVFIGNYARSFGGAVYVVFFGKNTQHIVRVMRSVFEDNVAIVGAGAFVATFYSLGLRDRPHTAILSNCSFSGNVGESGGAVLIGITDQINSFFAMERCNFTRNGGIGRSTDVGSAFAAWLVRDFRATAPLPKYHMTDCYFDDNNGTNGVVSLAYVPFAFFGTNTFSHNQDTSSLRIVGSLVEVHGALEFYRNEVASLELLSSAQVQLKEGARMEFTENTGRLGSSISVNYGISLRAVNQLTFNPLCFMLFAGAHVPPLQWKNVSVVFRRNVAVLSSSIYAATFADCTWSSEFYPFFNSRSILEWPVWDFGNDSMNTGYDDKYSKKFHVGTEAREISTPETEVLAWPGRRFNLPLTGTDEFGNPTVALSRFNVMDKELNNISIFPQVVLTKTFSDSKRLPQFQLKYGLSLQKNSPSNSSIRNVSINVPFESSTVNGDQFGLNLDLCPGGYELVKGSNTIMECQCLEQIEDKVVNCEQDQDSVIIEYGYWVSTAPFSNTSSYKMHFYTCPAGYCRCVQNSSVGVNECVYLYVNSDPDAQCSCYREGVLCGECKHRGVSALFNHCVTCNDSNAIIIVMLVAIQIVVYVTILIADQEFSSVLFPLTFYIQLRLLPEMPFFFHTELLNTLVLSYSGGYFHEGFVNAGQYLYFLGSALSFYFPYDFCLYRKMSPLISYFLRFLPLIMALLVVPITYRIRQANKSKGKLKHHGVWTIVLLIYTHTVHTCMSVLNCPKIIDNNGRSISRWFHSGNIECFSGGHLPLALLSIIILLLAHALIPYLTAVAIGNSTAWMYLEPLKSCLSGTFRKHFKGWVGVELSRRSLFVLLIVLFPREKVAVLLLLCIMIALYGFFQPYRSLIVNIVELAVQINSILFFLLVASGVLEPYLHFQHPFPDATDGNNNTQCKDANGTSSATWILLPLYYLPALVLLIIFTGYCTIVLKRAILATNNFTRKVMLWYRQRALRKKLVLDELTDSSNYVMLYNNNNVTSTEVTIHRHGSDMDHELLKGHV